MISNQIAEALATAEEIEKAQLAHHVADALAAVGLDLDDTAVRQIVAAFDRYAAEHGAA
ncbi:MAG TPA: hypothetical protein PLL33_10255 [Paracoccus sp. (in: a-proteobacteria)]|nr:hypothetical protein [Paracoccus sp. (in: a-proteobacteria)]